jgi:hypothetical protein
MIHGLVRERKNAFVGQCRVFPSKVNKLIDFEFERRPRVIFSSFSGDYKAGAS